MRLLLVNGNTTGAVTETMLAVARGAAGPGTEVAGATAGYGAALISSRAANEVAAHAILDLLADRASGFDAVLIAVSVDTALRAARALLPIPVAAMTEAALLTACQLGGRFGLITFDSRSTAVYREVVESYGLLSRLAGIRTIDRPFAEAYRDQAGQEEAVVEAAEALARECQADSVILAGAAAAGIPARLRDRVPVPLLDGIVCGVLQAEALYRLDAPKPSVGSYAAPLPGPVSGLTAALTTLLSEQE